MEYLLDTNICIYIIKKKPEIVLKKFKEFPLGSIGISTITLAELPRKELQSGHWTH